MINKISLIEPKEEGSNVYSIFKIPRLGLPIIGTLLKRKGYQVKIFFEKIKALDWEEIYSSDLVGISSITGTVERGYHIADKVRQKGIPVVMGGSHVTFMPEEALKHADYVIHGEGEGPMLALIEALNSGGDIPAFNWLSSAKGPALDCAKGRSSYADLNIIPDLFLIEGYQEYLKSAEGKLLGAIPIAASRGCPYSCKFCSVVKMFGRYYRLRNVETIIEDIKTQIAKVGERMIIFVDDNFAVNKEHTKRLLKQIIKEKLDLPLLVQVRIEIAKDRELLLLMKEAKVRCVYVGVESVNPATLKAVNKQSNFEDIEHYLSIIRSYKIKVHAMFVIGSDHDNQQTLDDTLEFSIRNKLETVQMLFLTPLPGTELAEELMNKGRIFNRRWGDYDLQHVTVFPSRIRPSVLQAGIVNFHKRFFSLHRIMAALRELNFTTAFQRAAAFIVVRRFEKQISPYLEELKKIEQGHYDPGNVLLVEKEPHNASNPV